MMPHGRRRPSRAADGGGWHREPPRLKRRVRRSLAALDDQSGNGLGATDLAKGLRRPKPSAVAGGRDRDRVEKGPYAFPESPGVRAIVAIQRDRRR